MSPTCHNVMKRSWRIDAASSGHSDRLTDACYFGKFKYWVRPPYDPISAVCPSPCSSKSPLGPSIVPVNEFMFSAIRIFPSKKYDQNPLFPLPIHQLSSTFSDCRIFLYNGRAWAKNDSFFSHPKSSISRASCNRFCSMRTTARS